ncbi:MAG: reverse transcriptase domain-containing protein [Actinomycetota bacterium]
MVARAELSTAWREVREHDRRRFEIVDVIGFADGGPGGRDWRGGPWSAEGRLHRSATIPKAGGRVRLLCVLDPPVHARYRALVARVAPAIERCVGPSVGWGRSLPVRGLCLEPWRPAWRRHSRAVARLAVRSGPMLRMDVRDFFGSVGLEPLCDALTRARADREDVEELRSLLRRFAAGGIRGLPVGPEPSAVLANLALVEADRALARLGLPFVRWCDDVTVGLGRSDRAAAVQAWTEALHPLGLRPATEKTRMLEPGEPLVASRAGAPRAGLGHEPSARPAPIGSGGRARSLGTSRPESPGRPGHADPELLEHAASLRDESDPHAARAVVGRLALAGGREARLALRHVLVRFPEHAPAAQWGLSR